MHCQTRGTTNSLNLLPPTTNQARRPSSPKHAPESLHQLRLAILLRPGRLRILMQDPALQVAQVHTHVLLGDLGREHGPIEFVQASLLDGPHLDAFASHFLKRLLHIRRRVVPRAMQLVDVGVGGQSRARGEELGRGRGADVLDCDLQRGLLVLKSLLLSSEAACLPSGSPVPQFSIKYTPRTITTSDAASLRTTSASWFVRIMPCTALSTPPLPCM